MMISPGTRQRAWSWPKAAWASGLSGSRVTVWPLLLTLRAASQCRRMVVSDSCNGDSGHLVGLVVEDPPDDLLRHILVEQRGAQRVPPLVGNERDRLAVLVTDVAASQPAAHRGAVGGAFDRCAPVEVLRRPRDQDRRAVRPQLQRAVLLVADLLAEYLIDRDQRLPFHLVVVVAQVGGAVGVGDDAVEGKLDRVADPQAAAHQDQGDQPVGRAVPPVQVGGVLQLRDDMLSQRPGEPLGLGGPVLGVDPRAGGQGVVPAVSADRGEEPGQGAEVVDVCLPAGVLGVQVSQVAFQQLAVELGELVRGDRRGGEEGGQPGDRADAGGHTAGLQAGCQPPPAPPFGQVLQPRLGDLLETDRRGRTGDVEVAQPPGVSGVLDVPASADGECLDALVGVQDESAPSAAPSPAWPELRPDVLRLLQQRGHPGGGQVSEDPRHRGRDQRRLLLVTAALQHVLHLQPQRLGQRPQIDAFAAAARVLAGDDELVQVRSAVCLPAHVVVLAQRRRRARPQVATGHPAGGR
jgi:hypothetical protein